MSDERLDELIQQTARDYNVPGTPPRDVLWARIEEARRQAGVSAVRRSHRAAWLWPIVGVAAVLMLGFALGRFFEQAKPARTAATPAATGNAPVVAQVPETSAARDTTSTSPSNLVTSPRESGASPRSHRDVATRDHAGVPIEPDAVPLHDDPTSAEGLAFRLAVLQHLAGTEAMLTTFRTEAKSGEVDARLTSWARNLLRTTHLLQASSVASNDPTLKRLLDDLELVLLQIAQYTAKSPHRAEELELIERSIDKRGVMAKLRATNPAATMPAGT